MTPHQGTLARVDYDVLVVGSGFGGSVAALRLAEKGYRVGVLESGRRFGPEDFARTSWNLRRYLFMPRLGLRGIQRLTLLRDVLVLSGAGVGGGSLVYANTLMEPLEGFFADPAWTGIADWAAELGPHYAEVRRMLRATRVPVESAAEDVVREVARRMGAEETFRPTEVAVDFDRCVLSGNCMVGCRFGAKNTLDRTYLADAEGLGARVHAETEAVRIRRAGGAWEVETRRPGAWLRRRRRTLRAEQVVLAAGALGTTRLLLRSGLGGPRVGDLVRTNSESLVGATVARTDVDYSVGVAIGSAFEPDAETRIEPVRYGRGSNLMGLLGVPLVSPLRAPVVFLRGLSVRSWSERTVVLLVMQSRDNALRVRLRRGRLTTSARTAPGRIELARIAARHAADVMGGVPGASLNEVLLGIPTTAHVLGGAAIGSVLDGYGRVVADPGLHVVDGAAVPANLGANPSLTIAALAERALSLWPNRGDPDRRPAPGEPYRRIASTPPRAGADPRLEATPR